MSPLTEQELKEFRKMVRSPAERWFRLKTLPSRIWDRLSLLREDKTTWDGIVPDSQCCDRMAHAVGTGEIPIEFSHDSWGIQERTRPKTVWSINYCPWCGTEIYDQDDPYAPPYECNPNFEAYWEARQESDNGGA